MSSKAWGFVLMPLYAPWLLTIVVLIVAVVWETRGLPKRRPS